MKECMSESTAAVNSFKPGTSTRKRPECSISRKFAKLNRTISLRYGGLSFHLSWSLNCTSLAVLFVVVSGDGMCVCCVLLCCVVLCCVMCVWCVCVCGVVWWYWSGGMCVLCCDGCDVRVCVCSHGGGVCVMVIIMVVV